MVFIDKSKEEIPEILTTAGVTKRDEHIADFAANEESYRDNSRNGARFDFDSSIYGDLTVKETLANIQNFKCCFCESKYKHITSGDVEHFRPKAAYSQGREKINPYIRPGYFWLAYDWDNLLVSCEVCNRRNKKSYFPIKNRLRRCQSYQNDINIEDPWFINPSQIDPEVHITFYKEMPTNLSFEGAKTIDYLELDREELNEMRRKTLNLLKGLEDSYLISIGFPTEERTKENFFKNLRDIINNKGEYYLMIKVNFEKYLDQL